MKPILLFDIDKTLFDTEGYIKYQRSKFAKFFTVTPDKIEKVESKYQKSLTKHTDYNPQEFIKHLINHFHVDKDKKIYDKLLSLFYEKDNFTKNLFPDTISCLKELKSRQTLGIFSEGLPSYQKTKLVKLGLYDFFNPKQIYIYRRKTILKSLAELSDQTTIVDDNATVIQELLDQKTTVLYPIWLNRKTKDKHPHAKTIHSLTGLI